MKKRISFLLLVNLSALAQAQTNIFESNGNVGIGTSTPVHKLDVAGGLSSSGSSHINGVSFLTEATYYKKIKASGFNLLISTGAEDGHLLIPYNTSAQAQFYNLGLSVDKNIAVGTMSPIGKLDIRGNAFVGTTDLVLGSAGSFVQIDQGAATGDSYTQIRAFSNGGSSFNNLILQNGGGGVGIGVTDTKGFKLAVGGNMVAESVLVKLQGNWPDYVFGKHYQLSTLTETEQFIKDKGHLPGVPSADEVRKDGINLEEMNAVLLKKIEELTLHLIEQGKELQSLKTEMKSLKRPSLPH